MQQLPQQKSKDMPDGLSIEPPARNLASLCQSDGIREINRTLLSQWKRAEAFADVLQYGIRPLDRVLFYGPPGNGKTVTAQLIATELDCTLYRIRCESLVGKYLGQTTGRIGDVLDYVAVDRQAVILWDEVESLFPDRRSAYGDGGRELVSGMQVFWQRLDRWSTPQIHVLATNMIEQLDQALLSRIDLKLEFGPPTEQQCLDVLEYWTEVLHEYGSYQWCETLRSRIESGTVPTSFRDLWQQICFAVKQFILSEGK